MRIDLDQGAVRPANLDGSRAGGLQEVCPTLGLRSSQLLDRSVVKGHVVVSQVKQYSVAGEDHKVM